MSRVVVPPTQVFSPHLPAPSFITPPVLGRSVFGDMSDAEHVSMKVQLLNRLNAGRLANMPSGFPFHHIYDGHGSYHVSYDSFEFCEELLISAFNERPRCHSATIAFTQPTPHGRTDHLIWRILFPTLGPYARDPRGKFAVAHVQVDPAVMHTPYGRSLMEDPRVILRALAMSLELGVLLTIQLKKTSSYYRLAPQCIRSPLKSRPLNGQTGWESVVYLITNNDGRQEQLLIIPQYHHEKVIHLNRAPPINPELYRIATIVIDHGVCDMVHHGLASCCAKT